MVIPLRTWLARGGRPGRPAAGGWSDEDVARLRDGLKRGDSLPDLAASLERSPEEVAARICEFRPVRTPHRPVRPSRNGAPGHSRAKLRGR